MVHVIPRLLVYDVLAIHCSHLYMESLGGYYQLGISML